MAILFTYTGTMPASGTLRFLLSSGTDSPNGWTTPDNASLMVS